MATNFGPAREYNVFVFDQLSLRHTSAEGRVAVGGTATVINYGVGARITPLPPANSDPSFVIGGAVNATAGSNASGNTVVSPTSTVIHYTMGNPNGSLAVDNPIDFLEAERYLKRASVYWATLEPNGVAQVLFRQLNLTAANPGLNVFTFESTDIYGTGLALNQLNSINITAPLESTILINITGPSVAYGSCQIFRNGVPATREDAKTIVWNYPEALTWSNSTTAIYGSVLAPFADATSTFSQINGNVVFSSLAGNAECHNELFAGELPEPASYLLPTSSADSSHPRATTISTPLTASAPHSDLHGQSMELFESLALQQAALARILIAEGEKLQKMLSTDTLSHEAMIATNQSLVSMLHAIAHLEAMAKGNLDLLCSCLRHDP